MRLLAGRGERRSGACSRAAVTNRGPVRAAQAALVLGPF